MSGRGDRLHRIDGALAELAAIQSSLAAARRGNCPATERGDLIERFHTIAGVSAGHDALASVRELATLAARVAAASEVEVVQQAADVLSLLLSDLGHQLLGRRGADVRPAAAALRERLEHELLAACR